MRLLTILAIVGGAVLAAIGFVGSYSALAELGSDHGFGWFARVFPIGVDAGIVVMLALDLHLIRKQTPWPALRWLAHLLTAATIVFNAASGDKPIGQDPIGAAMHGVLPLLFVAAAEAGRRLVIKAADIDAGRSSDGVPLHRWLLAPTRSFAMYRRMRLYGIDSYTDAVKREKDLVVYRVMLDKHTTGGWKKAPADARLPMTMAPYGLTVDEALALPQEAAEAAQLRREREEDRKAQAQARAEERAKNAEITRLRSQGEVETTRHAVAGETGAAQAEAEAKRLEAQAAAQARLRATTAEEQALESAGAAEARARQARAEVEEAEARKRAAETDRAAAETERAALETRRRQAEENKAIAAAEAARAQAERDAEAARAAALETRARAAEMELRALEAEDAAKLTPRERAARKVARLILTDGRGDPDAIELATIAETLGVSVSTASDRRKEAADLIRGGYTPTTGPVARALEGAHS